ncbi:trans-sialidase, partial [Trypanosoma conorhini]
MSLHWLSSAVLLLFLLVCCGGSGAGANAAETQEASKEVELFKPGEAPVLAEGEESGSSTRYKSVSSFYSHSLLDVNGVLVALAVGAHSNTRPEIWAKYSAYGANEKLNEDAALEGKAWKTQLVTKRPEAEGYLVSPFGPQALGKGNKIHLLLQKRRVAKEPSLQSDPGWGLALIVGEVRESGGERGERRVSWEGPRPLDSMLARQMQQRSWKVLQPASMSRGVAVGDATVLFPLMGTTNDETGGRACTVMYSSDNGDNWGIPAAPVVAQDCDAATLLEWEGKLFMATSGSSQWRRRIFESGDKGKTWNEAAGPFSRLLGDAYALTMAYVASALTTATISGRSVLLYTTVMSVHSVERQRHHVLHLWLSDGARTHDVGPISADDAGDAPFSSLLYTRDELFALYAKVGESGRSDSLVFASLPQPLQRIKSVLQTWKDVDARVAKLCSSATTPAAAKGAAEPAAACVGAMPTDGLVGFLSNNGNNTHWKDEYLGVGATVFGATKVANGFVLAGRGASIVWPVGRERRNPGHGSVGEEVTLVATVTINKAPQGVTPVLGVGTAEAGMYLGLWYDEHKRWRTKFGGEGADAQTLAWEEGKAYRVVLTVGNGTGSAYVDGQLVGSLEEKPPFTDVFPPPPPLPLPPHEQFQHERVSHIFVGEYRYDEVNAEVHVTVTNVFLYSRCFNASEVAALERKEEASVTEPEEVPLRTAAPAVSDPKNSAHDEAAAAGG